MLLDLNRTLKIADFGVARVEAQNPRDMTGETGTLGYMAPEVCIKIKIIYIYIYMGRYPLQNNQFEQTVQTLFNQSFFFPLFLNYEG